jgi:hypothetical protein
MILPRMYELAVIRAGPHHTASAILQNFPPGLNAERGSGG